MLRLLCRAAIIPAGEAARIGARVLGQRAIASAGQVVAELAVELTPGDIRAACRGAITLSGDDDDSIFRHRAAEPAALLALAAVDLPSVTDAITDGLADDDDARRADAAEAARYLLVTDPTRVVALGEPLVRSIRGKDIVYAGYAKPAASAARALAEAWRGMPAATAGIIERNADALSDDGREELMSVLHSLHRWGDDTAIPSEAVREAVAFALRRLDGAWGGRVAGKASDELLSLAKGYPDDAIGAVDGITAAFLAECRPQTTSALVAGTPMGTGMMAAMTQFGEQMAQQGRRRDLAETLGVLARSDADRVVPSLLALLEATTGDDQIDTTTRAMVVRAIATSVTDATVAGTLPVLYTCLLSSDQSLRAAAIELWQACAGATATLPDELAHLVPTLLTDPYVIVHRTMLGALRSLGLPREVVGGLLPLLMNIADMYRGQDEERTVEAALQDVLWAADRCDDAAARRDAAVFVIAASLDLRPYPRERLLLDRRVSRLRQSSVWAAAALRTLADPRRPDRFNQRDDKLLKALLAEPRGLATIPLAQFRSIADLHLPDYTGAAAEPVELLQAAGRWRDAAELATAIADAVPESVEHRFAHHYLHAVAAAAAAEHAALARAPLPAIPEPLNGGENEPEALVHARARFAARSALASLPAPDPAIAAAALTTAVETLLGTSGGDRRCAHHISVLRVASHLLQHDAAVRSAAPDAGAHLAAAKREADVLAAAAQPELGGDDPIVMFTATVAAIADGDVDDALAEAAAIAVALPLSDRAFSRGRRAATGSLVSARPSAGETFDETPTAVCVLGLDGHPVVDVVVIRRGYAYDLSIDVRLRDWPQWADTCHVELLTTVPLDALTRPQFVFTKHDVIGDDHGVRLTRPGTLLCSLERHAGRDALDLPLHVRFSGPGRSDTALVAGYVRLRIRPYDPSRDALTAHTQIDQRLLELYDPLHDDPTLDADDVAAFCRMFTACVRAAQSIMFYKAFRAGRKITEQQFHDALEDRLRDDPELEGRLTRRDAVAGGYDDLLHDDVIAELKVEKNTPRTVEDCARFIGQPMQYGVGRGSRLSILVVLDHSPKDAPAAVLENYLGWLHPAHHALDDPRYPSRVGVLIINTSWSVPSSWSRRRLATREVDDA